MLRLKRAFQLPAQVPDVQVHGAVTDVGRDAPSRVGQGCLLSTCLVIRCSRRNSGSVHCAPFSGPRSLSALSFRPVGESTLGPQGLEPSISSSQDGNPSIWVNIPLQGSCLGPLPDAEFGESRPVKHAQQIETLVPERESEESQRNPGILNLARHLCQVYGTGQTIKE